MGGYVREGLREEGQGWVMESQELQTEGLRLLGAESGPKWLSIWETRT